MLTAPWTRMAAMAAASTLLGGACADGAGADDLLLEHSGTAREAFDEGLRELGAGRPERAEEAFLRATAAAPDDPDAHFQLGLARYHQSLVMLGALQIDRAKLALAAESFDEAARLDPKEPSLRFQRGLTAVRAGDWERAAQEFATTPELAPGNALARAHLGASYVQLGREEEGLSELRAAVRADPESAYAELQLGLASQDAGAWGEAAQAFEAATRAAPEEPSAWYGWSSALRRLGRAEDANRALARHPELSAGRAEAQKERGAEARAAFEAGAQAMRAGRAAEAAAAFRTALKLEPGLAGAHANLGLLSLQAGDRAAARA